MRLARAGAAASANGACGAVVIAARMRLSQPSSLAAITPFHTLRAARQRRHRAPQHGRGQRSLDMCRTADARQGYSATCEQQSAGM